MRKRNYFKFFMKQYFGSFFTVLSLALLSISVYFWYAFYDSAKWYQDLAVTDFLFDDFFQSFRLTIAVISTATALIFPLISLRYIYDTSDLDNYFAVNAKKSDLLKQQIFYNWILVIVPTVLTLALNGLAYYFALVRTGSAIRYPELLSTFGESGVLSYLIFTLLLSAMTFFFVCLSSLITVGSTNIMAAVLYTMVTLGIPSLYLHIVDFHILRKLLDKTYEETTYLRAFSPLESLMDFSYNAGRSSFIGLIVWSLLGIGLFFACIALFEHYKVERVNSEKQFSGFYEILTFLMGTGLFIVAVTAGLYYINDWTYLAFIYGMGLLVYYGVVFLRSRSKPDWKKTLINWGGMAFIGTVIAICLELIQKAL